MGGSVTRNGKNVDKEIERQTSKKFKSEALKRHKDGYGGGHRTYPLKGEVSELRKHRGEKESEEGLASYRRMKKFSKDSGTWGKKNIKS